MDVLVSDICILIDLERGGLQDLAFPAGHRWLIPDLLYATELAAWSGPAWLRRGLQVVELSAEETATAQRHFHQRRSVSINDCAALAISLHRHWTLCTGDAALRQLALEHHLPCHGVLWIVELAGLCGTDCVALDQGLRRLLQHPRCRLPVTEAEALLRRLMGA